MNKLLLGLLPLAVLAHQVEAQTRQLSGRVTDRSTGEGLPGATVLVKGTTIGVSTNADGTFTVSAPTNSNTLLISSVGYLTVERAIGADNQVNIGLAPDTKQLGEVVVSALGVQQSRDEQGVSISQVSGASVARSGETSAITGLSGKASGVQITRSGGDPGAGAYIQIRGQNSITGSNQPLIVIDGVPVSNSTLGTYTAGVQEQSRLNDINPNDIESVQVLKGAAAAALWGSRAANGVIYITTKRGAGESGKINVTYGVTYSMDRISYRHDLQDTYGHGSGGLPALNNEDVSLTWGDKIALRSGEPDAYLTRANQEYFVGRSGNTYYPLAAKNSRETFLDKNFDAVFQTGHFLENNLSVSSGNKDGNVFLSVSDLNQEGIIRNNSDYRRTTGRLNAFRNFNNVVKVAGNIAYSRVKSNRVQQGSNTSGLYLGLLRTPADFDNTDYIGTHYDGTGSPYTNRQRSYRNRVGSSNLANNLSTPYYNNPLWTINEQINPTQVDRFLGNIELTINPRPWLTITARPGVDTYTDSRLSLFPINSAENGGAGYGFEELVTETQFNADVFARATHTFTEKLSGNLMLGANFNQRQALNVGAEYFAFLLDVRDQSFFKNATSQNTNAFDTEAKQRSSAGYGTAGLVFDEQVFLNATGRFENASTFGPLTQSLFFYPSADLAWQFTKLAPLADNKILSFGKLRAAFGQVGLQPGSASVFGIYLTRDVYTGAFVSEGSGASLNPSSFNGSFARSSVRGNPFLRPERKREFEVGADLRFLADRMTLGVTYYTNKITDAILPVPVAPSSGYTLEWANPAKLQNKGLEIDFGGDIIKSENLNWNIGGNWSRNRNLVTEMAGAESIGLNGFIGTSARAVAGYPMSALWGGRFERNDAGELVLDAFGFPQAAPVEGVIGDPNPDWRSGINTTLTYKGLRLFALWETSYGGDIWAGTESILRNFGVSEYTNIETTLTPEEARATPVLLLPSTTTVTTPTVTTVAAKYPAGADGNHTFRGRLQDFGGGNVALDQAWYTGIGGGFGPVSEQFIQDATWTRLREVTVGYTLATEGFRKLTHLGNVELTLTGRNLLLFTKEFKGVDPETNLTGASNGRGLEYFNNPGTRSFLVGLRINY